MSTETSRICELVADACDLIARYRHTDRADDRVVGEVLWLRTELATHAAAAVDIAVADDACGAVIELNALLDHFDRLRVDPPAELERALSA